MWHTWAAAVFGSNLRSSRVPNPNGGVDSFSQYQLSGPKKSNLGNQDSDYKTRGKTSLALTGGHQIVTENIPFSSSSIKTGQHQEKKKTPSENRRWLAANYSKSCQSRISAWVFVVGYWSSVAEKNFVICMPGCGSPCGICSCICKSYQYSARETR